jgi:regulator of RNase E activity RraA
MKLTTAQICDALVQHPAIQADLKIFTTDFPIFSNSDHLEGILEFVEAGGDPEYRRKQIASAIAAKHVVLIENFGRTDCAGFEKNDLADVSGRPEGIIVNGALRDSSWLATRTYSIRARAVNPMPFSAPSSGGRNQPAPEAFPFRGQAYVVGDGDSLIVLRSEMVLVRLGLREKPLPQSETPNSR